MTPSLYDIFRSSRASTYLTPYDNQETGNLYTGRTSKTGAPPSHALLSALGEQEIRQACIIAAGEVHRRWLDESTDKKKRLGMMEASDLEAELLGLSVEELRHDGRDWWVVW